MSMHDLFGGVDDPVTEACRMLAEHDLVVVPGSVMRECMNVLHILACDTESVEEGLELQALIHHIEAAWAHGMPPNAGNERPPVRHPLDCRVMHRTIEAEN